MTFGSILTIISILIAMVSFAYNSYQRIVLFKIKHMDYGVGILYLLLVSYLLMFDYMVSIGWYLKFLLIDHFPSAEQWAYVCSVFFLGYCYFRFFRSHKISKRKYTELIEYYEELMGANIALLLRYISDYHKKELLEHITNLNHICDVDEQKTAEEISDDERSSLQNEQKPVSLQLPALLLDRIIFNPVFIKNSIRHNPLFFLEFVHSFNTKRVCGLEKAVTCYYQTLISESNPTLVDAIRSTNNYLDDKQ